MSPPSAPGQATEPLFVTAAAALVLQTRPSPALVWSLVPIVVGVSVASATDVSFSWVGCAAALGSNLASTARNVYSKQVMSGVRGNIDSVSLLTVVNALAFLMLLPFLALIEGPGLAAGGIEALRPIAGLALLSAVLLQLYQQVSYNILSKVSAVTHSVANCVKRVVVIVAAVIFFRHPVSPLNAIGTALALGGVFMYSQQKLRERGAQQKLKALQKEAREAWAAAAAKAQAQ
jgi:solute carrier family 35 protein E1